MSEPKKDWRKELKEIVQETLKDWKPPKENVTLAPSVDSHAAHNLADLLSCPDCYPKVKAGVFEKEKIEPKKEEESEKDYECSNCGEGLDGTEEDCPTCHGSHAVSK